MKKLAAFAVLAFLVGCGPKPDIAGRKAFWEDLVSKELPLGMSEGAIKDWGKKKGVEFTDTGTLSPSKTLTAWVENIPDHSTPFCDKLMIQVEISLNAEQVSTSNKVESVGSCL